jgi:hypothetical protein
MKPGGRMRLSEETCVYTRPLEAGLLKDLGHLFFVGIDRRLLAEYRDELVEVHGRLPLLNGIRLRAGCIFGRDESLRERDGCGITTAARDERDRRQSHREGMAKRKVIDPTTCGSPTYKPCDDDFKQRRGATLGLDLRPPSGRWRG